MARRLAGVLARSAALLATAVVLIVPAGAAAAADLDALLAQGSGESLRQTAPTDLTTAQGGRESGELSDTPPAVDGGSGSAGAGPERGSAGAHAAALPFTGADARLTLLLGVSALLLGAGLRLRTGDARDY